MGILNGGRTVSGGVERQKGVRGLYLHVLPCFSFFLHLQTSIFLGKTHFRC